MENKTHSMKFKKTAYRLLWIVVIETAIILGMVCGFAICLINEAQATDNSLPEFNPKPIEANTKALTMAMTVAEIAVYKGVEIDIEIPEEETVVEEEEEEPEIDWSEIIDVKKYARAPYNLDVISEGYVRPPLNDEVYKVVNGIPVTNRELHMLGLTIWGEANGQSMMEQAAVAWSILNRVDNADGENFARGHSLTYVLQFPGKAPGQIHGYWNTKGAKCADYWLMIAIDVVNRWALEWEGAEAEDVGRVLPKEYTYWCGVNGHNRFRTANKTNEPRWDWSLPNPYEEGME